MVKLNSSTYKEVDTKEELTIEYSDLYIHNKTIIYNTTESIDLPLVSKWNNIYKFRPEIKDLNSFPIDETIELGVIYDNLFYGNVGHGLWDGIYPAWVSLNKFGYIQEDFTFITHNMENQNTLVYPPTKVFAGKDILSYTSLPNKNIHIKKLVVGSGNCGNLVMRKDYTLYGKKWDSLKLFRNRMYDKHGISLKSKNKNPKIIWIENKRYTTEELKVIHQLCQEYNIPFIEYKKLGNFKEQLEYFSDVDIQITGPGTGMMYAPFIKDGGVIVNLGWMEHPQTNTNRPNIWIKDCKKENWKFPSYMEQGVISSIDWISVLYYDRYKYNTIEYNSGKELIQNSIKQYQIGPNKEKHAIDGQIYIEYCKRDLNSSEVEKDLTHKALFAEMMINEHPLAIEKVNLDLLREIRKDFNYDEQYVYHIDLN